MGVESGKVEVVKERVMPRTNNAVRTARVVRVGESTPDASGAGDASGDGVAGVHVHDRIRRRAFELFLARCGGPGDALSDWLEAERQVRSAELRRGRDDVKAAERGEALLAGESD